MCIGCWAKFNHADVDNERVQRAVELIAAIYEFNCVGGNMHIQLDDWNLETRNFTRSDRRRIAKNLHEHTAEQLAAEFACFDHMRWMTVAERASALARFDGFL
jgi:hypothetical protein